MTSCDEQGQMEEEEQAMGEEEDALPQEGGGSGESKEDVRPTTTTTTTSETSRPLLRRFFGAFWLICMSSVLFALMNDADPATGDIIAAKVAIFACLAEVSAFVFTPRIPSGFLLFMLLFMFFHETAPYVMPLGGMYDSNYELDLAHFGEEGYRVNQFFSAGKSMIKMFWPAWIVPVYLHRAALWGLAWYKGVPLSSFPPNAA